MHVFPFQDGYMRTVIYCFNNNVIFSKSRDRVTSPKTVHPAIAGKNYLLFSSISIYKNRVSHSVIPQKPYYEDSGYL